MAGFFFRVLFSTCVRGFALWVQFCEEELVITLQEYVPPGKIKGPLSLVIGIFRDIKTILCN